MKLFEKSLARDRKCLVNTQIYMTTTSVNQFTSSLLLTVMSADRYIAVCHPINSPKFRTPMIAKVRRSPLFVAIVTNVRENVCFCTWLISFIQWESGIKLGKTVTSWPERQMTPPAHCTLSLIKSLRFEHHFLCTRQTRSWWDPLDVKFHLNSAELRHSKRLAIAWRMLIWILSFFFPFPRIEL